MVLEIREQIFCFLFWTALNAVLPEGQVSGRMFLYAVDPT